MCLHPSLALYMHPQFVCFCSCSRLPLCVEQTYSLSLVFRISFSHGDSIPLCVCTDLSVSVVLVGVWVCVGILYVTLAHFFLHIVQAKVKTVEIERARERERKEKHTPKTPANANFISFSIENVRVVLFSVVHKFNTLKIN